MENTQKIQISVYKAFEGPYDAEYHKLKLTFGSSILEEYKYNRNEYELVYEAKINNIADFVALTYRFDKQVKYKKPTDKNWYTARSMMKRLFKNEVANNKPIIKIVEINDWKQKREEKRLKAEAAEKRRIAKLGYNPSWEDYFWRQDKMLNAQKKIGEEITIVD